MDSEFDDVNVYLHYTYHPRGDATNYYSKSSVTFPYEISRGGSGENQTAQIFLQSPSSFDIKSTRGQLNVSDVKPFDTKQALLADATNIFQSFAQTALKRRIDGDGIQKYLPLSPDFVSFELYVSTGCQVQVDQSAPAVCAYDDVFVEAWVSSKGSGAELVLDFYREYITQGADMLAMDAALESLEKAQEKMLQTLDLPLTE